MAEIHRNSFQINLQWGFWFLASVCVPLQVAQGVTVINAWQISECGYHGHFWKIYQCSLQTVEMTTSHPSNSAFSHERGKTNDDVEGVSISNFTTFPTEGKIGETFRNLKKLEISDKRDATLKRSILSKTFENMEKLTDLDIELHGEEKVDVGFLTNLVNLEGFIIVVKPKHFDESIQVNATVDVSQTTFQANSKLKHVRLGILRSVPWNLFRNNLLLDSVSLVTKTELDARTFETNVKLKEIDLISKALQPIPWNLFKNNVMLERVQLGFRMAEIDERTFETNKELRYVHMNNNQLAFLPRDLFKNSLLLEVIDFEKNKLKIIEIDFSAFQNVRYINLSGNSCINSTFGSHWDSKNFNEFLRDIDNCSGHS